MTPAEKCPACGTTITFLGLNGCRAATRTCQHPWHCREVGHLNLSHMGVHLPFPKP